MEFLLIAGLLVVMVHAACKANSAEQAASAAQITQPASVSPTAVTPFAGTGTPSPATAQGAPGANGQFSVKLNTTSYDPTSAAGYYTLSGTVPGTNGVPTSMTPGAVFAGYDNTPAAQKQLSTLRRPGNVGTVNLNQTNGIPVRM